MARPITLCAGQWADLPLETLCAKAKDFGFDGLELCCGGNQFDVAKAMADSELRQAAAANAGQVRLEDVFAEQPSGGPGGSGSPGFAAQGDLAGVRLGRRRSGRRARPGRRGYEELRPGGAAVGPRRGQRLHRLEHLAPALLLPAGLAGDDRRRLQAAGRAIPSDPRRVRRVQREVRPGSPPDGNRLRPLHGRAGGGGARPIARSSASISIPAT